YSAGSTATTSTTAATTSAATTLSARRWPDGACQSGDGSVANEFPPKTCFFPVYLTRKRGGPRRTASFGLRVMPRRIGVVIRAARDRILVVERRHVRRGVGIVRHRLWPVGRQAVVRREDGGRFLRPAVFVVGIESLIAVQVVELPDPVLLHEHVLVDAVAPLRVDVHDAKHHEQARARVRRLAVV